MQSLSPYERITTWRLSEMNNVHTTIYIPTVPDRESKRHTTSLVVSVVVSLCGCTGWGGGIHVHTCQP